MTTIDTKIKQMKQILTIIALLISSSLRVSAQEFDKNIATARSSYASGDLSNAHFINIFKYGYK